MSKRILCFSLLIAFAVLTVTAIAEAPQANPTEVLQKTTHGRNMLTRDSNNPEDGRFLRALTACIRYYTGGER